MEIEFVEDGLDSAPQVTFGCDSDSISKHISWSHVQQVWDEDFERQEQHAALRAQIVMDSFRAKTGARGYFKGIQKSKSARERLNTSPQSNSFASKICEDSASPDCVSEKPRRDSTEDFGLSKRLEQRKIGNIRKTQSENFTNSKGLNCSTSKSGSPIKKSFMNKTSPTVPPSICQSSQKQNECTHSSSSGVEPGPVSSIPLLRKYHRQTSSFSSESSCREERPLNCTSPEYYGHGQNHGFFREPLLTRELSQFGYPGPGMIPHTYCASDVGPPVLLVPPGPMIMHHGYCPPGFGSPYTGHPGAWEQPRTPEFNNHSPFPPPLTHSPDTTYIKQVPQFKLSASSVAFQPTSVYHSPNTAEQDDIHSPQSQICQDQDQIQTGI